MAETDAFNFSKFKLFEEVKSFPENARGVVDIYEDLLFAWDFKDDCLKVVNWRLSHEKEVNSIKIQVGMILIHSQTELNKFPCRL